MQPGQLPQTDRPFRVLWANCYCLLDSSSGASMAVRRILHQLRGRGLDIRVLGAANFDTGHGMATWKAKSATTANRRAPIVEIDDDGIPCEIVRTVRFQREAMLRVEENTWYKRYTELLDEFRPDLVMTYGGHLFDLLITQEARRCGIPVAFYLGNGQYKGVTWCRDIDLILTDSDATRDLYMGEQGFQVKSVGTFIRPGDVVAETPARERVLFVNPSLKKGAAVVAALAARLETSRPDITFEVVEARGDWNAALQARTGDLRQYTRQHRPAKLRHRAQPLGNVVLTPNTTDMRPVYARARLLLVPSLGWESGPRVAAEALMNGIPVLASNSGGPPEQIDGAGLVFDFPEICHQPPHTRLPPDATLDAMAAAIERLYDDRDFYQGFAGKAGEVVARKHDIEKNTDRLVAHLAPLLARRAGDDDIEAHLRRAHRHGRGIVNVR